MVGRRSQARWSHTTVKGLRQNGFDGGPFGNLDWPAELGNVLLFGLNAKRPAERGEHVSHVDLAFLHTHAVFARLAVSLAPLDAAAAEHARPGRGEVVAPA